MPNADYRDCLEVASAIANSVEQYDSDDLTETIIPHLQPVIGELNALRELVTEIYADIQENEKRAPNPTWLRRYYETTGEHMIRTEYGWEEGHAKQAYLDNPECGRAYILEEVNGE